MRLGKRCLLFLIAVAIVSILLFPTVHVGAAETNSTVYFTKQICNAWDEKVEVSPERVDTYYIGYVIDWEQMAPFFKDYLGLAEVPKDITDIPDWEAFFECNCIWHCEGHTFCHACKTCSWYPNFTYGQNVTGLTDTPMTNQEWDKHIETHIDNNES